MRSILIIAGDAFLAGIYGRKFERDGWEVDMVDSIEEGKVRIAKIRPDVILIEASCTDDVPGLIRQLKALPTMQKSKVVVLTKQFARNEIQNARNAGADQYLILGHFVPHEVVEKMRELINDSVII